jgi:hypothetical protein
MSFPFKGIPPCPSVPTDSPSTTPYMGLQLASGPISSGGTSAMLSVDQACSCSTPCCGGGNGGGGSGSGGNGGGAGPGGASHSG